MDYIDAGLCFIGLMAVAYFIDYHIAEPFDLTAPKQTKSNESNQPTE